MTLSSLTPAEIDALWIQQLAESNRLFAAANADDATAARYERAGAVYYADRITRYREQAATKRAAAREARDVANAPFMAEWDARGGWTRAYVVPGGHIHKETCCHTLHPTTLVSWLPEQSGWTEDEIVAAAGVHACTVCYPSAPVEALRAAEAAAKAATQCPGSGTWEHDSSGLQYMSPRARCNHCGQTTSVTKTGKLRGHKPAQVAA